MNLPTRSGPSDSGPAAPHLPARPPDDAPSPRRDDHARGDLRFHAIATALILLVGLSVIQFAYRDFGMGWDDSVQAAFGEAALRYYTSGFRDHSYERIVNLRYYGPLFEIIAAILGPGTNEPGVFEFRHLLTALTALFTLPPLLILGGMMPGDARARRTISIISVIILATMPRYFGHAFINSKDIPFTCLFTWSMIPLCGIARSPRPSAGTFGTAGVLIGLTAAVRPTAMQLLIGILASAIAWRMACPRLFLKWSARGNDSDTVVPESPRSILAKSFGVIVFAWIIMTILWPWAQVSPLTRPFIAAKALNNIRPAMHLLYGGRVIINDNLPRDYAIRFLLITTPPTVLILLCIGSVREVRRVAASLCAGRRTGAVPFLLLVWIAAPNLYFVLFTPSIYDGIRHFMFTFPAIALLAATGAEFVLRSLRARRARQMLLYALAVAGLWNVGQIVRLYPYPMTYFNMLAGGDERAARNYDTDYWLTSYREAALWINERSEETHGEPLRVLVAANILSAANFVYYVSPEVHVETTFSPVRAATLPDDVDYYVATTRYSLDRGYSKSPIVHSIGRGGMVFCVIRSGPGG